MSLFARLFRERNTIHEEVPAYVCPIYLSHRTEFALGLTFLCPLGTFVCRWGCRYIRQQYNNLTAPSVAQACCSYMSYMEYVLTETNPDHTHHVHHVHFLRESNGNLNFFCFSGRLCNSCWSGWTHVIEHCPPLAPCNVVEPASAVDMKHTNGSAVAAAASGCYLFFIFHARPRPKFTSPHVSTVI